METQPPRGPSQWEAALREITNCAEAPTGGDQSSPCLPRAGYRWERQRRGDAGTVVLLKTQPRVTLQDRSCGSDDRDRPAGAGRRGEWGAL